MHPHHPYQQAFANPDARQELIAYVLTHVHSVYAAVNDDEPIAGDRETLIASSETQAQLEDFIRQGIQVILQQHPALIDHQVPEEDDGNLAASHWFG